MVRRLNPGTPVLATTATANARVTEDVAAHLGESTLVLRGPLARASLQLSVVDALSPLDRFAWVVEQLPAPAGLGDRLHAHGRRRRAAGGGDRRPPRRRAAGGGLHRQAGGGGAGAPRGRPARQRAQGAGRDQRARHGLRQARPRLLRARRLAAVARVVLPAGRPRGPGPRPRPRGAAPVGRRRRCLGPLRDGHDPRPRSHARASRRASGRERPRGHGPRAGGGDRLAPRPGGADAQAARRRWGRGAGGGRMGRDRRAVGLRRGALRRHRRGPPARGRHHARVHPRASAA